MKALNTSPFFSVAILNYNGKEEILPCISSVLKSNHNSFEVILIDNGSTDDSLHMVLNYLKGFGTKVNVVCTNRNLGFCKGFNFAAKYLKGEVIIFLSVDTVVDKDWLKRIEEALELDETIGAAEPMLYSFYDKDRIESAGSLSDRFGFCTTRGASMIDHGQYNHEMNSSFVGGAVFIARRETLDKVGYFDSSFFMNVGDVDLSWRIRLSGYRLAFIPSALVFHRGSAIVKKFFKPRSFRNLLDTRKNRLTMLIKNYSLSSLMKYLPIVLFVYIGMFVKELLLDRRPEIAITSILAILENVRELDKTVIKRMHTQRIRKATDREIFRFMLKKPLFLNRCQSLKA